MFVFRNEWAFFAYLVCKKCPTTKPANASRLVRYIFDSMQNITLKCKYSTSFKALLSVFSYVQGEYRE